jgi:hypothetical protein
MSDGDGPTAAWPADIIHVNEDGWVLINRGRRQGVTPGLRLLVVGQGIRELRDLFAAGAAAGDPPPLALRIRRTYEQLEVIHAEESAAIAIATRTPPERRPQVYTGPDGELLVWVPLPAGFSWPPTGARDEDGAVAEDDAGGAAGDIDEDGGMAEDAETGADQASVADAPPERGEQDDERWDEALPLNGVNVGDLVLPAIPATTASGAAPAVNATASAGAGNPFEAGRSYDWMQPGNQGG